MQYLFFSLLFLLLTPASATAQVIINEVYPAPSSGPEWIELSNTSLSETIELENWTLFDQLSSPNKIHTFTIEKIYPQGFLVIELISAKLNNSADGVTLKNSLGETINEMQYNSSKTGMSWSKNLSGKFELTQPSKGTINLFPSPSPSPSPQPSPSSSPSPSISPSSSPNSSPSPNPSPSPKTNQTTEKINPSPTQSPPAMTQLSLASPEPSPTPPLKPQLPYSLQQIYLGSNSITLQPPPPTLVFTHHEPSLLLILSVILGGLLLFLTSSWMIYEKFWKNKNSS